MAGLKVEGLGFGHSTPGVAGLKGEGLGFRHSPGGTAHCCRPPKSRSGHSWQTDGATLTAGCSRGLHRFAAPPAAAPAARGSSCSRGTGSDTVASSDERGNSSSTTRC